MNHETKLAQLLVRMGTERGVDVETILSELSRAQFPSFVDAGAVRESLVDAVESRWRADLESRINQLRTQFVGGSTSPGAAGAPPVYEPQPSATTAAPVEARQQDPIIDAAEIGPEPLEASPVVELPPDATIEDLAVETPIQRDSPEALPSDATMIWNTRGG